MRKRTFIFMVWVLIFLMLIPGSMAQIEPSTVIVILVVDDFVDHVADAESVDQEAAVNFSDFGIEQVASYAGDAPNDLCYLNPSLIEGQAMADGMGGGEDANGKPLPHGDLILAQVLEMLAMDRIQGFRAALEEEASNPVVITAVPVDTNGYTLTAISDAIDGAMADIDEAVKAWASEETTVHYIINMSFALVPCDSYLNQNPENVSLVEILRDLAETGDLGVWDTLKDYIGSIAARSWVVANTICPPYDPSQQIPEDSAGCQLERIFLGENVISVASAGNFGLGFPTLPGAWESVVSVSGGQECEGFRSAGGPTNRIIFLTPTFMETNVTDFPAPCPPSGSLTPSQILHDFVEMHGVSDVKYYSSSGEIMMPGLWRYVAGMLAVREQLEQAQVHVTANNNDALIPLGLYRPLYNDFYAGDATFQRDTFDRFMQHDMEMWEERQLERGHELVPVAMGTSFAAPRFSVAMALYLAEYLVRGEMSPDLELCQRASFQSANQVIGFSYGDYPLPNPPGGEWLDISLAARNQLQAEASCDEFFNTSVPDVLMLLPLITSTPTP